MKGPTPRAVSDRFWTQVNKFGPRQPHMRTRCWVWASSVVRAGYGQFAFKNAGRWTKRFAHRMAWELRHGRVPKRDVLHKCDNPPCVRPIHLFEGTHADNMHDRDRKGRLPRGDTHRSSRITSLDVRNIRRRAARGEIYEVLGQEFGLSKGHICGIVKRRFWKHVK